MKDSIEVKMDDNRRFWDRSARFYTAVQERLNGAVYRRAIEIIRPWLGRDDEVVELACGTGQFTVALSIGVKSWLATDYSQPMVNRATRRLDGLRNVITKVLDATDIGLPDNSVDVVFIANALHIVPYPVKVLGEIHRVLKHDGILIAPTFIKVPRESALMKLYGLSGFRVFSAWNKEEFEAQIASAGFHIKHLEVVTGRFLPECVIIASKA